MNTHIAIIDFYKNTTRWNGHRVITGITTYKWLKNGVQLIGEGFQTFIPYSKNIANITITKD